ncbi:uncharacterized protein LOC143458952 [Clavelina lepadiformis]|uniref:uncharacterized protein LOC143458952 n=1 Tax=Clavelina lepadiformis TaxID=159417 RepID=UPI004041975E
MKVICAGAPKTGTKSLARALRILGYDAVYDVEEAAEFGFEEWEDLMKNRQPDMRVLLDTVYSNNVEAVVDMPHSYFFDRFLERWPDAKVILSIRDEDEWFRSFKGMVDRAAKEYPFISLFRSLAPSVNRLIEWNVWLMRVTVGIEKPDAFVWKTWYRRHNKFVQVTVPPQQLLEYRVKEGWAPLCKFLDKPIPKDDFPFENKAGIAHNIANKLMQDTWIAKKAYREIILVLTLLPVFFAFIVGFVYFNFI